MSKYRQSTMDEFAQWIGYSRRKHQVNKWLIGIGVGILMLAACAAFVGAAMSFGAIFAGATYT